jgi:asparagine synthase (glutamine-hydrolysing)
VCGITGICKKNFLSKDDIENVNKIAEKLYHRGPNQNSSWFNSKKNVFFSHRRLSINDLSSQGIQPMISQSGRYVIIFNGAGI